MATYPNKYFGQFLAFYPFYPLGETLILHINIRLLGLIMMIIIIITSSSDSSSSIVFINVCSG